MANNTEAGGSSRQLSVEELAREKNADFWTFFDKPAGDVAEDVHGGDESATNSGAEDVHGGNEGANNSGAEDVHGGDEGANNSGAEDGNDTTTSGAGDGDVTIDGGERTDGSQAKKD